jgi:DNA polymerase III epsilon subunit-like protein
MSFLTREFQKWRNIFNGKLELVKQYEGISRLGLKFGSYGNKENIALKMSIANKDIPTTKENKLKLLARLLEFKRVRKAHNADLQQILLEDIEKLIKSDPNLNLSLTEVMAFVKNDGCIFQRDLTRHFGELLSKLDPAMRLKIADYIDKHPPLANGYKKPYTKSINTFLYSSFGFGLFNKYSELAQARETQKEEQKSLFPQ